MSSVTFGSLQSVADIRALLDFRKVLEGESAARAAQCKDRHLLHAITAKRRLFDAALNQGKPAIDEDIAFHRAIAEAGGNRFFVLTMAALEEQFRYAVKLVRELSPQTRHHRTRDVREEHRAIDDGDRLRRCEGGARCDEPAPQKRYGEVVRVLKSLALPQRSGIPPIAFHGGRDHAARCSTCTR